MHMTKESEYALLGLTYLVYHAGSTVAVADVAAAQGLPAQYLAKIFNKLARHGLLVAERGRGKGFVLTRAPESISMSDVIEAVEGPDVLTRCLLWQGHCHEENPCPLHYRLGDIVLALRAVLAETTLADYVANSPHSESGATGP